MSEDNKLIDSSKICDCPPGVIKYSIFIKDKDGNKLCSICKKIDKLKRVDKKNMLTLNLN